MRQSITEQPDILKVIADIFLKRFPIGSRHRLSGAAHASLSPFQGLNGIGNLFLAFPATYALVDAAHS